MTLKVKSGRFLVISNLVTKWAHKASQQKSQPIREALVWKLYGTCRSKVLIQEGKFSAWVSWPMEYFPSANQEMYARTSHVSQGFLLSSASQANHHLQVTWEPEPSCSQVLSYLLPHHSFSWLSGSLLICQVLVSTVEGHLYSVKYSQRVHAKPWVPSLRVSD